MPGRGSAGMPRSRPARPWCRRRFAVRSRSSSSWPMMWNATSLEARPVELREYQSAMDCFPEKHRVQVRHIQLEAELKLIHAMTGYGSWHQAKGLGLIRIGVRPRRQQSRPPGPPAFPPRVSRFPPRASCWKVRCALREPPRANAADSPGRPAACGLRHCSTKALAVGNISA